jgi:hypothetical protein
LALSDRQRQPENASEVQGWLLALNHARYAEEVRQSLYDKGAKKGKAKGVGAARGQGALFGD